MQISVIDLFEVSPETYSPEGEQELAELLSRATTECEKRESVLAGATEHEQELGRLSRELDGIAVKVREQSQQLLLDSVEELNATTTSCDTRGLAQRLRAVQDQAALVQDGLDMLRFIRYPAALIAKLEAVHTLRRAEAMRASLAASLSKMQTIGKLITARVFRNEARIALISSETEALTQYATKCQSDAERAEADLREERKRQQAFQQQRMAIGQTTRIEAAHYAVASRNEQ